MIHFLIALNFLFCASNGNFLNNTLKKLNENFLFTINKKKITDFLHG